MKCIPCNPSIERLGSAGILKTLCWAQAVLGGYHELGLPGQQIAGKESWLLHPRDLTFLTMLKHFC